MKRFLIASAAAAISVQSAAAKTIHLTCKEAKVLQDTHVIKTAGRISNRPENLNDLWTHEVMINTDQGISQVTGQAYELRILPDAYRLNSITDEKSGDSDSYYLSRHLMVNRKDLSFTYSSLSQNIKAMKHGGYDYGRQWSTAKRNSEGVCTLTPTPANNKI